MKRRQERKPTAPSRDGSYPKRRRFSSQPDVLKRSVLDETSMLLSLWLFVFPLCPFKSSVSPNLKHTNAPPPVIQGRGGLLARDPLWICRSVLRDTFNGAEEEGKRFVISSAAQPVCLQMMSPPHYNERRGGDGPNQVSGEDRGWSLSRNSAHFHALFFLGHAIEAKLHKKRATAFLECRTKCILPKITFTTPKAYLCSPPPPVFFPPAVHLFARWGDVLPWMQTLNYFSEFGYWIALSCKTNIC